MRTKTSPPPPRRPADRTDGGHEHDDRRRRIAGVSRPVAVIGDFKDVLAHLASGVAIVSCWDGETPRGLLVSSITGLSVEPPRFLFCVRKEAGCHDVLLKRPALSVALLGAADRDEAVRFGGPVQAHERFAPERWRLEPDAPRATVMAWPAPPARSTRSSTPRPTRSSSSRSSATHWRPPLP